VKTRITLVLLFLIPSSAAAPPLGANAEGTLPTVRILDPTPDRRALVEWATDLYLAAGLELPPLRVDFASGTGLCPDGVDGRFVPGEPESLVLLCPSADANDLHRRHIILHEFAHAWDHYQLSDPQRHAFMELRSAEAWHAPDLAWWELGSEQAAEIMAWGLIDQPLPIIKIDGNSCQELHAGFELLVGSPPLHGLSCHV
jgi:hypothetical protein